MNVHIKLGAYTDSDIWPVVKWREMNEEVKHQLREQKWMKQLAWANKWAVRTHNIRQVLGAAAIGMAIGLMIFHLIMAYKHGLLGGW